MAMLKLFALLRPTTNALDRMRNIATGVRSGQGKPELRKYRCLDDVNDTVFAIL